MEAWREHLREMLLQKLRTAGTKQAIAERAGMSHSALADIMNMRTKAENIRLGTLVKLFPDLDITFFAWQRPSQDALDLAHAYDALPEPYRARLLATLAEIRRDRDRDEAAARRQRPDAETG